MTFRLWLRVPASGRHGWPSGPALPPSSQDARWQRWPPFRPSTGSRTTQPCDPRIRLAQRSSPTPDPRNRSGPFVAVRVHSWLTSVFPCHGRSWRSRQLTILHQVFAERKPSRRLSRHPQKRRRGNVSACRSKFICDPVICDPAGTSAGGARGGRGIADKSAPTGERRFGANSFAPRRDSRAAARWASRDARAPARGYAFAQQRKRQSCSSSSSAALASLLICSASAVRRLSVSPSSSSVSCSSPAILVSPKVSAKERAVPYAAIS